MSSLKDVPQTPENGSTNSFRNSCRWNACCARWSRRYAMALLLFVLLIIEQTRNTNVFMTIAISVVLGESSGVKYNAIGEWSLLEIDRIYKVLNAIMILAQIPGAILIFKFSSHKYLITSIVISSILHMLTPLGLHHHSAVLIILMITETTISASVRVAVISVWKDWSPPLERTKLVMVCFLAIFADCATAPFLQSILPYFIKEEHYYITGIAGLLWALFWYCTASNIPENDPLISENELRYLEYTLPSEKNQEIRLRDVPWKNILCSKQVHILCFVFLKAAYSFQTIIAGGLFYRLHLSFTFEAFWLFIWFSLALVLVPFGSAIIADILLKRSRGEASTFRLKFLCGGFLLQCILLFGFFSPSDLASGIFFMLAYLAFAASLPGFITMPLDLSPRYVSIILGFAFTAFYVGTQGHDIYMEKVVELIHLRTVGWLFLVDGILTIICLILFFFYADFQEQPWSTIPKVDSNQETMEECEGGLNQIP